jgi:hypothetical protein
VGWRELEGGEELTGGKGVYRYRPTTSEVSPPEGNISCGIAGLVYESQMSRNVALYFQDAGVIPCGLFSLPA